MYTLSLIKAGEGRVITTIHDVPYIPQVGWFVSFQDLAENSYVGKVKAIEVHLAPNNNTVLVTVKVFS